MSDDLRDAFGEDIFMEPEEENEIEEETGEAQNKTFLIAVAGLGGLLFLAIGVFILWALVLNPRMQAQQAAQNANIQATNTAIMQLNGEADSATAAATGETSPGETADPTETPEPTITPTPTPVIKATNTPTIAPTAESGESDLGEESGEEAGEEEPAEATATPKPRRTPTPTRTPRSTPTPKKVHDSSSDTGSGADATPETGLGEWLLVAMAALLLGLIVFARRLRKV